MHIAYNSMCIYNACDYIKEIVHDAGHWSTVVWQASLLVVTIQTLPNRIIVYTHYKWHMHQWS